MEDRETARMRKYGESKTTRIMMATVPYVTSGLGLRKFQADGFFVDTNVHYLVTCWPGRKIITTKTLLFMGCFVNHFLLHASSLSKRSDSELDLLRNNVSEPTFSKYALHQCFSTFVRLWPGIFFFFFFFFCKTRARSQQIYS